MSIDVITAFDVNGAPLAGLTPTWAAYKALDGGAAGTEPTIEAIGGGQYRVLDMPVDRCGIVDLGATAAPRYAVVDAKSGVTFAAFDAAGTRLAGLTPSWATVRVAATGAVVGSPPTFADLGGGLYRVDGLDTDVCGIIDLGASANPRGLVVDLPAADQVAPVVANVSPSSGTTIGRGASVTFEVTDTFPGLRRAMVIAKFDAEWEVVHDGDSFGPKYSRASVREAISGGYRFRISRIGGWPSSPTLLPIAIDQAGNENA
jgi:hypothetical protein